MNQSFVPMIIGALVVAVGVLGYMVYDMQQQDEASIVIELPKIETN